VNDDDSGGDRGGDGVGNGPRDTDDDDDGDDDEKGLGLDDGCLEGSGGVEEGGVIEGGERLDAPPLFGGPCVSPCSLFCAVAVPMSFGGGL